MKPDEIPDLSLEWIPANQLRIDPSYQRDERTDWVKKLTDNWDWTKCFVLAGNRRGNYVYLTNGQQRRAAMMNINPRQVLPVVVSNFETKKDEAVQFLGIDTVRRLSTVDKWNAGVIAEDELTLEVQGILDELGLKVGKHAKAIGGFKTTCRTFGADSLRWALEMLIFTYGAEDGNFPGWCVNGLARFVAKHGALISSRSDADRFAKKLAARPLDDWERVSIRQIGHRTAGGKFYKTLVEEWDRGLTGSSPKRIRAKDDD